jgi:hypothetical protein
MPLLKTSPSDYQKRLINGIETRRMNGLLLRLAVQLMFPAIRTEFLQFQPLGCGSFVLRLAVVPVLTFRALELNNLTRHPLRLSFVKVRESSPESR